jgi:hypothetical protein
LLLWQEEPLCPGVTNTKGRAKNANIKIILLTVFLVAGERISIECQEKKNINRWRSQRMIAKSAK